MTLTASEAVSLFSNPITAYKNIGRMQRELLKRVVIIPNETLASTRLLSLMYDTDVGPLLYNIIEPVSIGEMTDELIAKLKSVNDLFSEIAAFENVIRTAVSESSKFLPEPTVEILRDYNTEGAPMDRLAVMVFVIMSLNLQE